MPRGRRASGLLGDARRPRRRPTPLGWRGRASAARAPRGSPRYGGTRTAARRSPGWSALFRTRVDDPQLGRRQTGPSVRRAGRGRARPPDPERPTRRQDPVDIVNSVEPLVDRPSLVEQGPGIARPHSPSEGDPGVLTGRGQLDRGGARRGARDGLEQGFRRRRRAVRGSAGRDRERWGSRVMAAVRSSSSITDRARCGRRRRGPGAPHVAPSPATPPADSGPGR